MMEQYTQDNNEIIIRGLKIPFGHVFVMVGKIYLAILLWSAIIGAVVGIFFLILTLIGVAGASRLF
jgi:hypothetical protein